MANSASSSLTRARRRATSARTGSPLGGFFARITNDAPWSRWSRHAETNDECKPSRRMISPRADFDSAASSSARTCNLYAAGYD